MHARVRVRARIEVTERMAGSSTTRWVVQRMQRVPCMHMCMRTSLLGLLRRLLGRSSLSLGNRGLGNGFRPLAQLAIGRETIVRRVAFDLRGGEGKGKRVCDAGVLRARICPGHAHAARYETHRRIVVGARAAYADEDADARAHAHAHAPTSRRRSMSCTIRASPLPPARRAQTIRQSSATSRRDSARGSQS